MRKFCFTFLLVLIIWTGNAQTGTGLIVQKRDSIYQIYKQHVDTMTVNTWLNLMNANRLLTQIHYYDSVLYSKAFEEIISDSTDQSSIHEMAALKKNIDVIDQQLQLVVSERDYYQRMFYIMLIPALLFLVLIVILILLTGKLNKSVREKENAFKAKYTELRSAEDEIARSRKIENQLASEINKLKKTHESELETGKAKIEELEQEKLMLDNQVLAIKRAYELELEKRTTFEAKAEEAGLSDQRIHELEIELNEETQKHEKYEEQIQELSDKLVAVQNKMDEFEFLKGQLDKVKVDYENELNTRLRAEEELEDLIQKLKNHFK